MSVSGEGQSYKVVVNDEGQYSLWPEGRANAPGWRDAGHSGSEQDCLAYVGRVWTDLRPLSLRRALERPAEAGAGAPAEKAGLAATAGGD